MKPLIPVVALVVALSSCTAAYKSGQTPDDVYFSPARPAAAHEQNDDEYVSRQSANSGQYRGDDVADEDRYLRMKVRNRRTWSDLDYYYSDPYAYNYYSPYASAPGLYYNTPWNSYSSWNYYYNPYSFYNPYSSYYSYNPYYTPYGYGTKFISVRQQPVYSRPRMFNLNTYNPQPATNGYSNNGGRRVYRTGENRNFNYYNNNTSTQRANSGNTLRNVFNNSNSNSAPARSYTPAPAPSRSSGSSNAPVRRF